jgi:hypothetical protein
MVQVYPKITVGVANMYDSSWWQRLVRVWELLIYNPVMDLEAAWLPLLLVAAAGTCGYRWWRRRRRLSRLKRAGERDLNV